MKCAKIIAEMRKKSRFDCENTKRNDQRELQQVGNFEHAFFYTPLAGVVIR